MSDTNIEYESNGNKNKTLSSKECFDEIKPYLKDIVNNLKKSHTTIAINFFLNALTKSM